MKQDNHKILKQLIKDTSGQENILAIPRKYIDFMGSLNGGIFLSQLIYWSDKTKNSEGYVYKTYDEWEKEIAVSKYHINKETKKMIKMGFLETKIKKANGNPTVHYKFNIDLFTNVFVKFLTNENESFNNQELKNSLSITEITSETTPKTNKIDIIVDENKKTFSSTLYFLFNKYFDQINGNIDSLIDSDYEDIPDIIIKHFCYYQYKFGKKHPSMKNEQMENVLEILEELFEVMGEKLFDEHIQYWQRNDIETDYNLNHFVKFVEGCPGLLNRV